MISSISSKGIEPMGSPPPRENPETKSYLVIHQGALGDFLLALPALESLRRTFPLAKPAIMGYPRILELVENRFYAQQIFSVDQKGMASFFVQEGSLDPALSKFFKSFDLLVLFRKDGETPLVKNLRKVCEGRLLHIHSFPPWDKAIHLTDHLLKQMTQHGFSTYSLNPKIYLMDSDREWAENFWKNKEVSQEERSKVILLHPGSGSKKKVWPVERFLDLVRFLKDHLDSKILVILGPAEGLETRKIFKRIESKKIIGAEGLTLVQLASVMEGGWFFIGNDSGISHMAAALGLPTVVIFGPTDQRVWSPRGERAFVVRKGMPCSPCPQERFFQCHEIGCLKGIEMADVLEGIGKVGIRIPY